MTQPRVLTLRCENEHCRNVLPDPVPMTVRKRYIDERGRVLTRVFGFCSWYCIEQVASRAKDYASEEVRRGMPR